MQMQMQMQMQIQIQMQMFKIEETPGFPAGATMINWHEKNYHSCIC